MVTALRGDVAELRGDNAELRADNAKLRDDVAELRADNAELRADNAKLWAASANQAAGLVGLVGKAVLADSSGAILAWGQLRTLCIQTAHHHGLARPRSRKGPRMATPSAAALLLCASGQVCLRQVHPTPGPAMLMAPPRPPFPRLRPAAAG